MKLIDALTLTLKDLGIKFVFGVSGANIEHFHDAIHRLGNDQLTAILTKSEYSAAFMADGLARAHNTLGVCCSTSGGGMTNLAVGIAESYADKVPVLAIVGQIPLHLEGKGGFQDSSGKNNTLDGLQFWKSLTKYAAKIIEPDMFWYCLKTALQQIFSYPLGPAVLLIPRNMFESEVPERPNDFSICLPDYRTVSTLEKTEKRDIERLLDTISQAKYPLLIVGGGMRHSPSVSNVRKFVDHFNLKVATTLADVNAFPHDDPHYLGMIGIAGHPSVHHYLKNQVDLIIALGEEFSVMVRTSIEADLAAIKTIIINNNIETFLAQTLNEIQHKPEILQIANVVTAESKQYYKPVILNAKTKGKKKIKALLTSQALMVMQKFLVHPENIFFDAGNCVVSALHYLQFPKDVKTIISLGMGGMGYAIPAGIGAQLGDIKNKSTLVITGDGGFLISGLEIHTAVEYQLPILFIVFNNNKHAMCVTRQQRYFSHRITASTYGKLDIAKTVKGLGNKNRLWARCVNNTDDLENQLTEYYQKFSDKPGVLEIKIDIDEVPPFIPFLDENPETMELK